MREVLQVLAISWASQAPIRERSRRQMLFIQRAPSGGVKTRQETSIFQE